MSTRFTLIETALGVVAVAWRGDRIVRIRLPQPSAAATEEAIFRDLPDAIRAPAEGQVKSLVERLQKHMSGEPQLFDDVELDLSSAPPFHRLVYEHTRAVRPGRTVTYGELAEMVGSPGAARAVGQAMARNRFLIVIPCHRVVAASRRPGGFSASGGVLTKARLLEIEGVSLPWLKAEGKRKEMVQASLAFGGR